MISDEVCSKGQQLCVNNQRDSVKSPNTQMGFILKNVTIQLFTSSCYCLGSCHILVL